MPTYKDSEIVVYEKGSYLSYASAVFPFITGADITVDHLIQKSDMKCWRSCPGQKVLVKNLDTGEEFGHMTSSLFPRSLLHETPNSRTDLMVYSP